MLQMLVYWGAYAYFPALVFALWLAVRGGWRSRTAIALILAPLTILAWARFAEPALLHVKRANIHIAPEGTDTRPLRIALFADTHFGKFDNAMPMARIVDRINALDVDLVLIAGDFVYHPTARQIDAEIGALAGLSAPAFAVLGNHDVGAPGADLRNALSSALAKTPVTLLNDETALIEIAGQSIAVSGLRDLWDARAPINFNPPDVGAAPHIVIAHNPDTVMHLPGNIKFDLMVSGHTHGGQIRLPGLYRSAIPVEGPFDRDMHSWPMPDGTERGVWVTSGTGQVGLPMRFLVPPRIDVLTLHVPNGPAPSAD